MTVVQELNALDTGVQRATERLLSLQHPDGWWKGELESNATMIAEHLFLLHFLGLRDAETDRLLANELLARRRDDGTWSIWFDGPPDLSVTVEAYTALKLAGVDAGDLTREYIRGAGGVRRARIFTRAFLALIGQWPWRRLAHVPVELIMLPANGPLSVYDFACWARQTMVALSVVEALQPVRASAIDLTEIGGGQTAGAGAPRPFPPPRRPGAVAAGGWAFEFDNDLYPDVDDTAVVVPALRELGLGDEAVERGLEWMVGMQSRSGGWGAFDVDNEALWLYKLPICDFGKVTDEPTADVTAHALEALGHEDGYDQAQTAGLAWLLAEQEQDGSWFGRWGVNHVYGTGAAVPALEACGLPPDHPAIRRALAWLDSVQQAGGGFGEDIRSYSDPAWRGRGAATPSQTAWALLAYVSGGAAAGLSTRRAAEYLLQIQRSDGDWDEQHYTGTGFPLDFMIRYHLYRLTFPLLALGRLRERLSR